MRANAIKQETVTTGTGAITLTAVSGWPTYADVFGATGTRMVEYVVQDAAGLPIEGGVGEINLATMVLSRVLVQWTWNGTTYDNTAPTALSLASGTKQVICGPTVESGGIYAASTTPGDNLGVVVQTIYQAGTASSQTHQRLSFFWTPIRRTGQISKISLRTNSGYTGGTSSIKAGLYDIDEAGKPFNLLIDFGSLGSLTSGSTLTSSALATPVTMPPGDMYAIALLPEFTGGSGTPSIQIGGWAMGHSPFGFQASVSRRSIEWLYVDSQTSLPADASGLSYATGSNEVPLLVLG